MQVSGKTTTPKTKNDPAHDLGQMGKGKGAASDQDIITQALKILEERAKYGGDSLSSPGLMKNISRLKIGDLEHEVFACIWLDAQNRLIEFEIMFRGTLTQTSVYPREVVKAALKINAAAVVFTHNHPSGIEEPSAADMTLTTRLRTALELVDVKVLDHIIVGNSALSFA